MRLSVVIPTLNEAAELSRTIAVLRAETVGGPAEVIVADCGSTDGTVAVARRCGARVERSPEPVSRAQACNAGAGAAGGEVLLFLHADCSLPRGYDALIDGALRGRGVVGGAFQFRLAGPEWRLRMVEVVNGLRYRIGGRYFGDQGIFVRRRVFEAVGGFPAVGILEDARFCDKLRRVGVMRLVRAPLLTSPRRFYNGGILRTLAGDALIVTADLLGVDVERFAREYVHDNIQRGGGSAVRCSVGGESFRFRSSCDP